MSKDVFHLDMSSGTRSNMKSVGETTMEELRKVIREEVTHSITTTINPRLKTIEDSLNTLKDSYSEVTTLKKSV